MDIFGWSADSTVIYAGPEGAGEGAETWGLPIAGGVRHRLGSGIPSPDGDYRLITKPDEALIRTADGRTLCRMPNRREFGITAFDWSPDSGLLAVVIMNEAGGSRVEILRVKMLPSGNHPFERRGATSLPV